MNRTYNASDVDSLLSSIKKKHLTRVQYTTMKNNLLALEQMTMILPTSPRTLETCINNPQSLETTTQPM